MTTADLIAQLAADRRPVSRHKSRNDLAGGVLAGAMVTFCATMLAFGVQANLFEAEHWAPLLMKLAFVSALGVPAFVVVQQLARPATHASNIPRWIAAPTLMLAALAIVQLMSVPSAVWGKMVLGGSWQQCPVRILLLSIPILAGLLFALRQQAPVRLRRAGMIAGLLAGAMAAAIYALACTEATAAFVLLWYSAGIAATTATGALLGPITLRW